ncbi:MAG: hypothetical protein AB1724_02855 [Thermodesulfobacteriota bacterium]
MTTTISYAPFEKLIASLRADGLAKDADLLNYMVNKVAWSTGSELMEELGATITKIKKAKPRELSDKSIKNINEAMDMVNRVCPDFPR